jgi:hypothetical protein
MSASELTLEQQAVELYKIAEDPVYFARTYIKIKPDDSYFYQSFEPWPAQERLFETFNDPDNKYVILCKSRQLGMTACSLIYALWVAIVETNAFIFLVSKQKDDTYKLIDKLRLMYLKLPTWLREYFQLTKDNAGTLGFSNGSQFFTFASNKSVADGMTGRLTVIDEADLIPSLPLVLNGVMPAIAAGGQLIMLSKSNKTLPKSKFKELFLDAEAKKNDFVPVFLPWTARPDRDQAFYDSAKRNNNQDFLFENYPNTIEEAFAPLQFGTRFPLAWLESCALIENGTPHPTIQGLQIFEAPRPDRKYVIGADPAEGIPTGDDSSATVLDTTSHTQVAVLSGKYIPATFGALIEKISNYYNNASALVERNNHGHSVLLWLAENTYVKCMLGGDGKVGWLTTSKSKNEAMDAFADLLHCQSTMVRDRITFQQLASIECATLRAPKGENDDRALAFLIAARGATMWLPSANVHVIDPHTAVKHETPNDLPPNIWWDDNYRSYGANVIYKDQKVSIGDFATLPLAKAGQVVAYEALGMDASKLATEFTAEERDKVSQRVIDLLRSEGLIR